MDSAEVVLSGRATEEGHDGDHHVKDGQGVETPRSTGRVEFDSDKLVRGREGG